MIDTEVAVTLIAAFGGVVLGAGLAWLGERSRRRFEARAQLSAARGEAWTRMADTATDAYLAIERVVRQDHEFRWWDGQFIARFWLATQGYQQGLAARRELQQAFFDVRRLGPPAAVEHAGQLITVVEAAGEVAKRPRSRHARNPQTWAEMLERLVDARESLLELPTQQSERAGWFVPHHRDRAPSTLELRGGAEPQSGAVGQPPNLLGRQGRRPGL